MKNWTSKHTRRAQSWVRNIFRNYLKFVLFAEGFPPEVEEVQSGQASDIINNNPVMHTLSVSLGGSGFRRREDVKRYLAAEADVLACLIPWMLMETGLKQSHLSRG